MVIYANGSNELQYSVHPRQFNARVKIAPNAHNHLTVVRYSQKYGLTWGMWLYNFNG